MVNHRAEASSATGWIALIVTTGETVDAEVLFATRRINTSDKQKADYISKFVQWIESQEDYDIDLRYPQEWSWVLDEIDLDTELRAKLIPSDAPLVHQASHALRKHSYRLQAISLFG
jgi:hypothetical protein